MKECLMLPGYLTQLNTRGTEHPERCLASLCLKSYSDKTLIIPKVAPSNPDALHPEGAHLHAYICIFELRNTSCMSQ